MIVALIMDDMETHSYSPIGELRTEGKVGRARTGEVLIGGACDGKIKRPIVLHLGLQRHMQTTTDPMRCHRAQLSHQICAQGACLEMCIVAGRADQRISGRDLLRRAVAPHIFAQLLVLPYALLFAIWGT